MKTFKEFLTDAHIYDTSVNVLPHEKYHEVQADEYKSFAAHHRSWSRARHHTLYEPKEYSSLIHNNIVNLNKGDRAIVSAADYLEGYKHGKRHFINKQ